MGEPLKDRRCGDDCQFDPRLGVDGERFLETRAVRCGYFGRSFEVDGWGDLLSVRGDREREGLSDLNPSNLSDNTELGRTSPIELLLLGVTGGESDSESVVVGGGGDGFFSRFALIFGLSGEPLALIGIRVTLRAVFFFPRGEAAGAILGLIRFGESSEDELSCTISLSTSTFDRPRLLATSGFEMCFGMFEHESLLLD